MMPSRFWASADIGASSTDRRACASASANFPFSTREAAARISALAAGLTGAVAQTGVIVTAGLAEIAAGSIAMGLGGYLAARSDVALFDQTSFSKIAVRGPDAEAALQYLCSNDVGVPAGRTVYTALLNDRGGYEADVTVTRIRWNEYLLVTSSAQGVHDLDLRERAFLMERALEQLRERVEAEAGGEFGEVFGRAPEFGRGGAGGGEETRDEFQARGLVGRGNFHFKQLR